MTAATWPDCEARPWRDVPLAEVLPRLGATPRGRRWTCPACDDPTRKRSAALSVFRGRDGTELVKCYRCGLAGDSIKLVREVLGLDFREAVAFILGSDVPLAENARRRPAPRPARAAMGPSFDLARAWEIARTANPEGVRGYALARGADDSLAAAVAALDDVGWCPESGDPSAVALARKCFLEFRLLVALQDPAGVVRSVVRRWATPALPLPVGKDGERFAKELQLSRAAVGETGPLFFGSLPVALARAREAGALVIVEGTPDYLFASALAARGDLTAGVLGLPGDSRAGSLADALLDRLRPGEVSRFVLAMDADPAGDTAAVELAARLSGIGSLSIPRLPRGAKDLTDALAAGGTAAVVDALGSVDRPRCERAVQGATARFLDEGAALPEVEARVSGAFADALGSRAARFIVRGAAASWKPAPPKAERPAPILREFPPVEFAPVEEIREEIRAALEEATRPRAKGETRAPALIVGGIGTGKTHEAEEAIARAAIAGGKVVYSAPRHELLDDVGKRLRALGVSEFARTPDIRETCGAFAPALPWPEFAREAAEEMAARNGGDEATRKALRATHEAATAKRFDRLRVACPDCPIVKANARRWGDTRGKMTEGCPYFDALKDWKPRPGVPALATAARLESNHVLARSAAADVLLIDEDPLQELAGIEEWTPADLLDLARWLRASRGDETRALAFAREVLGAFALALGTGRLPDGDSRRPMPEEWHRQFLDDRPKRKELRRGVRYLVERLEAEAREIGTAAVPANLLPALETLACTWPRRYSIVTDSRTHAARKIVIRLRGPWKRKAPLTLLDGTGDAATYSAALGRDDLRTVAPGTVPEPLPESRTWWVPSGPDGRARTYSRGWFKAKGGAPDPERFAVLAADVTRILEAERDRREGAWPSVSIVCYGFLEKPLRATVEALGARVVGTRHYGETTSANDLQGADVLLVIGVHRPPAESYARTALLLGLDPAALSFDAKRAEETFLGEIVRYLRPIGAKEEAVHWQTIVPEMLQAAGRARAHLFATRTFLLGSHPLPLPGLEVWEPARSSSGKILAALSGKVPLSLAVLADRAGLAPDAARKILRRFEAWRWAHRTATGYLAGPGPEAAPSSGEAPSPCPDPGAISVLALEALAARLEATPSSVDWRRDRQGRLLIRAKWAGEVWQAAGLDPLEVRRVLARDGWLAVRPGGKTSLPGWLGSGPANVLALLPENLLRAHETHLLPRFAAFYAVSAVPIKDPYRHGRKPRKPKQTGATNAFYGLERPSEAGERHGMPDPAPKPPGGNVSPPAWRSWRWAADDGPGDYEALEREAIQALEREEEAAAVGRMAAAMFAGEVLAGREAALAQARDRRVTARGSS